MIGLGLGFDPFGLTIGPDLWLGISFSDPNIGLVLHNPPQIGSSGDRYWNMTTGMEQDFGGSPVANFVMSIRADLPLPVVSPPAPSPARPLRPFDPTTPPKYPCRAS